MNKHYHSLCDLISEKYNKNKVSVGLDLIKYEGEIHAREFSKYR